MIRAVSFDAGLTLVHPEPSVESVYRAAFARHGLLVSEDEVHRAVHATWDEVNARAAADVERWRGEGGERGFWRRFVARVYIGCGGEALPDELLAELVAYFADDSHWAIYPDARPVLAELRAAGLALLVVSNWDSSLPALLARLDLASPFDAVVVSAIVGHSKPSGHIFSEALRLVDLPAHAVLHVGDSVRDDYHGARAAGLHALLVDRGGRAPEGVDAIRSLAEIPARVAALREAPAHAKKAH